MMHRTQAISIALTIATALTTTLAATSSGALVSSEVVRGGSALSVLRCTYLTGLQTRTLHFVVTPESQSQCAWVPTPRPPR